MADFGGLGFDDEFLSSILSENPSMLDQIPTPAPAIVGDWETILNLKKSHSRTIIHGQIMAEYLHGKCSPTGLIVTNAPRLFLTDKVFVKDWSLIAWRCTRDWLILIITTAKRIADAILVEIQILEGQIKTTLTTKRFEKQLEDSNKANKEYKDPIFLAKIEKFKKDLAKFSHEKVYPYTSDNYTPTDTNKPKHTAGSSYATSSETESSGSESGDNSQPRGRGRGNRPNRRYNNRGNMYQTGSWWPPAPWGYPQFPPPMSHYPMQPQYFENQAFLGQGRGWNRGRRRGQNQVQWSDNQDSTTTHNKQGQ